LYSALRLLNGVEHHQPAGLDQIDDFSYLISWMADAKSDVPDRKWLTIQAWFWSNHEGWWLPNEVFRVLVRVKSPAFIVMKVVGDGMRVVECPQSGSAD